MFEGIALDFRAKRIILNSQKIGSPTTAGRLTHPKRLIMDTPLKIALNLLLALVIFAAVHFAVRAFLRSKPDRTNAGSLRAKIFVFDLVLTLVAIAVVQLAIYGFLRSEPPENVSTLMTALETPSEVTIRDMEETICTDFRVRFGDLYGIELEQEEADRFAELVKATDHTFGLRPFLLLVIRNECVRRKTPEKFFVHQSLMVEDPEEKERMKSEWIAAAEELLMQTAPYYGVMEPVFRDFYDWWTPRHPEFEGLMKAWWISSPFRSDAVCWCGPRNRWKASSSRTCGNAES